MSLPRSASANILRLLNTEDERNGTLAYRLLNGQQAADDFLLSLCGYFMVAEGEQRLVLRNCLRSLLQVAIREKKCTAPQRDRLLWLLNYDPGQKNTGPEQFLYILEDALGLDSVTLARFLFSRSGLCFHFLLQRSSGPGKVEMLRSRIYYGVHGQTLGLSRSGFSQLPEEARIFRELEGLDLSYNELSGSDVFFLLPFQKLRFLDLSHNRFQKAPEGLGALVHLQEADLRANEIKLSFFEYLRHPLKNILKTELVKEKGFSLDHFHPKEVACLLKNWIYDSGEGQVLDLRRQDIRFIPIAIRQFPQLKIVDLRENPIALLPSWFLKLPNLRQVYCGRGVEFNQIFVHEHLSLLRGSDAPLPRPVKNTPDWLGKPPGVAASLPVDIQPEDLPH